MVALDSDRAEAVSTDMVVTWLRASADPKL
jgi:hypothetical protein